MLSSTTAIILAVVILCFLPSTTTTTCVILHVAAWSLSSSPVRLSHNILRAYPSTIEESHQHQLSSAYDRNLPAALVGEAVRSALRSDRGICFDFTTDRYATEQSQSKLLSVIQVKGEGTESFINAKFSRSIPNPKVIYGDESSTSSKLVRKGHAFETAYLSAKGRIIDRLLVLSFSGNKEKGNEDDALLITSPGNGGNNLYNQLSPLVFPMDKVALYDYAKTSEAASMVKTNVVTLACSSLSNAQHSFRTNILDLLQMKSDEFEFPLNEVCHHYRVRGAVDVYVVEHTFLSPEICRGYTIVFQESSSSGSFLAEQVWQKMTAEDNDRGPVGMGALEYDTLRVEGGWAGYGHEITGDGPKKLNHLEAAIKEKLAKRRSRSESTDNQNESNSSQQQQQDDDRVYYSKANPLELHLQHLVDTAKGCYQGQEGVASLLKNKRGFPRQLYQVVFYDSENEFDDDFGGAFSLINTVNNEALRSFQRMQKEADPLANDTRQPRAGDKLFALGSSEKIQVGTLTSVAEPNGTGDRTTIALAMVRRPGPILKAIKDAGLDLPRWWEEDVQDDNMGGSISKETKDSGIMMPPPLDALVNLEVVLEGTYTVGRLKSIPSRRIESSTKNTDDVASLLDYEARGEIVDARDDGPALFKYKFADAEIDTVSSSSSPSLTYNYDDIEEENDDDDEIITDEQIAQAEKEAAAAEAAAAEAKRKAEKMAQLKARADAAMAARRKKKQQ
jgi:folate-binding Fe-S cluster repair protein YgfZ